MFLESESERESENKRGEGKIREGRVVRRGQEKRSTTCLIKTHLDKTFLEDTCTALLLRTQDSRNQTGNDQ